MDCRVFMSTKMNANILIIKQWEVEYGIEMPNKETSNLKENDAITTECKCHSLRFL